MIGFVLLKSLVQFKRQIVDAITRKPLTPFLLFMDDFVLHHKGAGNHF